MSEVKKTKSEDLEIGEDVVKAVATATKESVMEDVKGEISKSVEDAAKSVLDKYLEKTEKPKAKKSVADKGDKEMADDPVAKGIKDGIFTEVAKETKEMRFFKQAQALASGDVSTLSKYNKYSLALRAKAQIEKTGYANETTNADGAVLVPDPEFDTEVYDNLAKYGVAFQYADVRQTDRTAVYAISLDSGLEFYSTAEGGVKTSDKLVFSRKLTELQKYAVIVPSTDELTQDAAIDFWALVTRELTRAMAKKADEIAFTDSTYGITNTTGVITEPVSGAGTTITWEDMLSAESKVEDGLDTSGFRWFMRKETWFRLIALKGSANDHFIAGSLTTGWVPNPNSPTTPWGTPVTFTRVLPRSGGEFSDVVGNNDAYAVYGDLSNYKLYQKMGMEITILREATIVDTEDANFNLATQDGTAMRAVIRMLGVLPKGNAGKFVVLGTGTVS